MSGDDSVKRFSRLLNELTGLLRLLNRDDKICYGLTWPQAFTIEALAADGPLAMGELGERMGSAESTATRILDLLVRDGLVERRPGENDRRQVRAALTEAGREMAHKLTACREKTIAQILSGMAPAKRRELLEAMDTIKTAISAGVCCCQGRESE